MELDTLHIPESAVKNLLLENIQGGIVYSDEVPPFRLRYVTEGLAQMSGYTQDELLSMYQMDIVWEEDIESLNEDVAQQLAVGNTFSVEYRLKRKDGTYIYVLDRAKVVEHNDGNTYIHCLLTDITDLKRMEQTLRMSEEKYKLAMKHSGNVIFEYDIAANAINFSDNFFVVFDCQIPTDPLCGDWVVSQYKETVEALFNNVLENKTSASTELMVRTTTNTLIWVLLILSPVVVSDGKIPALVGCLQNIDSSKRRINELTELSQKDGLTGVYNRATMESLITAQLESPDCTQDNALILIDIDNFKSVNDQLGHATGDTVLIRVAQIISEHMPQGALLGRLGGDEFIVFAQVDSNEALSQLCAKLQQAVGKALAHYDFIVTISVGGARCSAMPSSFHTLYRNSDSALYAAKDNGRNGYTVFGA